MSLNKTVLVTKNFKYSEFINSYTAIRNHIDNVPPDDSSVWKNIEQLAVRILQPIRDQFGGIIIKSGYRCKELNDLVKGSRHSYHLEGHAADIIPVKKNVKLVDMIDWIYKYLDYSELIAEYLPEGWIHVAYSQATVSIGDNKVILINNQSRDYERVNPEKLYEIFK